MDLIKLTRKYDDKIKELENNIINLIETNKEHQKLNGELRQENKELKDNWTKLKEYIKDRRYIHYYDTLSKVEDMLNKMKELEDKNEI